MTSTQSREYQTAIHEAGHAAIARVLGISAGEASIIPTDDVLGYALFSNPTTQWRRGDGPKRPPAEAYCIALYAGREAESVIAENGLVGDGGDIAQADYAMTWVGVPNARFVGDEEYDRYEQRLRAKARCLVLSHRCCIEAVAAELMASRKLSGDEIDAIILRTRQ
jgi:ATP-dependent Zn protease